MVILKAFNEIGLNLYELQIHKALLALATENH